MIFYEGKIEGKREANEATVLKGYKKGLPVELLATLTAPELSVQEALAIIQRNYLKKE